MAHVHEAAADQEYLVIAAWGDLHAAAKALRKNLELAARTADKLETLVDVVMQSLLSKHQELELELDSVLPAGPPAPAEKDDGGE